MTMQTYDWIMLAVIAVGVLFGAWKGFAWQIASLAAIFVSYLVALRFHGRLSAWIKVDPPWNSFVAMFLIYAGCSLAIWIAFGFVRTFIERFHLKSFDRQIGAVLGAVKGGALCLVVTLFAVTLLGPEYRQEICQSQSGRWIAQAIQRLRGLVPAEIHEVLEPYLQKFDAAMAGVAMPPAPQGLNSEPISAASPAGLFSWGHNSTVAADSSQRSEPRPSFTAVPGPAGEGSDFFPKAEPFGWAARVPAAGQR